MSNAANFTPFGVGSLAWLLLGGNSSDPLSVVNLSSIPEPSRTFNSSGWFDLKLNNTKDNAYLSQIATMLVCDPNITYGHGSFFFDGGNVTRQALDGPEQGGQISHAGAEWMLGMGLDGIPSDTILTFLPLFNNTDASGFDLTDMGQLVFELTMLPPAEPGLGATPQDVQNISMTFNTYMAAIGPNIFFDGSLGDMTISANVRKYSFDKLELYNSWPYWFVSLVDFVIGSVLLLVMVLVARVRDEEISPLHALFHEMAEGGRLHGVMCKHRQKDKSSRKA